MRIRIMMAALAISSSTAFAHCPTQQGLYDLNKVTSPSLLQFSDLLSCLQQMRRESEDSAKLVEKLERANEVAWSAFDDPGTFLEAMPKVSADAYPAVRSSYLLSELRTNFASVAGPGHDSALESIERRLIRPNLLLGTYRLVQPVLLRTIETRATVPMALAHLAALKPLIEKPYVPNLGEQAFSWYQERCVSEAEAKEVPAASGVTTPLDACKTKAFAQAFEAHYGQKPTLQLAYWLSSMHRRYLRGGDTYIQGWQFILSDIAESLRKKDAMR